MSNGLPLAVASGLLGAAGETVVVWPADACPASGSPELGDIVR